MRNNELSRCRQFTAGSRQAPDPFDAFLENNGYYRKHSPRDSSCLFRCISEQRYGTQRNHMLVRRLCAAFILNNKEKFSSQLAGPIANYAQKLRSGKTFGTLLDSKACALLYNRNLIVFEPFDLGRPVIQEANNKDTLRIFYNRDKHFDSIFSKDRMQITSFCQSLIYKILYINVFKLPDIEFAIEQMLHDPNNIFSSAQFMTSANGSFPMMASIPDGRRFYLDRPHNTQCILENPDHCGFHNHSFPAFINSLKAKAADSDPDDQIGRLIRNLLPDRWTSCVRQVLRCGITPFPYKVAKSLDADMYRNVDFEVWKTEQDVYKIKKDDEQAIGIELRVGTKCLVKLRRSHLNLYNCYVEELPKPGSCACFVYVEGINQQCMVSLDSLRAIQHKNQKGKTFLYIGMRKIPSHRNDIDTNDIVKAAKKISSFKWNFKDYTNFDNFVPSVMRSITMPLIVDTNGTISNMQPQSETDHVDVISTFSPVSIQPHQGSPFVEPMPMNYYVPRHVVYPHMPEQWESFVSSDYANLQQNRSIYENANAATSQYSSGYSSSHTTPLPLPPPAFISPPASLPFMIRRRDLLQSHFLINYEASPSFMPTGGDLPISDVPTLRFFYNLGHELWQNFQRSYGEYCIQAIVGTPISNSPDPSDSLANTTGGNDADISDLANEFSSLSSQTKTDKSLSQKNCGDKRNTALNRGVHKTQDIEHRRDLKSTQSNQQRPRNFTGGQRHNQQHHMNGQFNQRSSVGNNSFPNNNYNQFTTNSPNLRSSYSPSSLVNSGEQFEKKQPQQTKLPQEHLHPQTVSNSTHSRPQLCQSPQSDQQIIQPTQHQSIYPENISEIPTQSQQSQNYYMYQAPDGSVAEPTLPYMHYSASGPSLGYNYYGPMTTPHFLPPAMVTGNPPMSPIFPGPERIPPQQTPGIVSGATPCYYDDPGANYVACYYTQPYYTPLPPHGSSISHPPHMNSMPYYFTPTNTQPMQMLHNCYASPNIEIGQSIPSTSTSNDNQGE